MSDAIKWGIVGLISLIGTGCVINALKTKKKLATMKKIADEPMEDFDRED